MNHKSIPRNYYNTKIKELKRELKNNKHPLKVKKKTISNLFRYENSDFKNRRLIDLSKFNNIIRVDPKANTLDVEGLTTFENIIENTLPHGLAPLITPELKHITIAGALVGIGVETNSARFGFVHDSLIEADVLLSNGRILTVSKNKNTDLFHALANSYGTLGYILRAKIKLRKIKPFILLDTIKVISIHELYGLIESALKEPEIDSIEALAYSKNKIYLTLTKQVNNPKNLKSIYGPTIFYKEISKINSFSLSAKDFLFRYDPDWFWNVPDNYLLNLLRIVAPKKIRNSAFYTKYGQKLSDVFSNKRHKLKYEPLVQDWEVPWEDGKRIVNAFFEKVNLDKNPIIIAPIKTTNLATLYPMKKNVLYLNLGCYCSIKRKKGEPMYHVTKELDNLCFQLGGIKMLYSSTFMTKHEFDKIYNGKAYSKLKKKYDPNNLLPTLYDKAVKNK